jgi:hypothetical protein
MTTSILAIIGGIVSIVVVWLTWWIKTAEVRQRTSRLKEVLRLEQDVKDALAKNDMVALARCDERLRQLRLETGRAP